MRVASASRSLSGSGSSAGSGARPSFSASAVSSRSASCGVVARLLRADLAAGDLLAALLEAGVDTRLLGRALAQLAGELLAGGALGGQLGLERLDAGADRRRCVASSAAANRAATGCSASSRSSRRRSCSSRRARSARSRSARSASRCSVLIAASTWARRSALGPSSGAARRCWMTQRAWRSASAASSRARAAARASRSIASRAASASATLRLGALDLGLRGALGLRGGLDLPDERVAAVALGEHAVGAAGRDLAQLAGAPATRRGRPW